MSNDLKPCPFCGSDRALLFDVRDSGKWYVTCDVCGCETSEWSDKTDAITRWNTRALDVRRSNSLYAIARGLRHIGRGKLDEEDRKLLADYEDGILRAIGEEQ